MANQVAFGAQLTESWKQIRRNRKLPNFMVILILIGLVFMVPCLVWGLVEARAHSGGGAPPRPPAVFMLYNGLLGLLYQPLIIGYFREFFCPSPASYSRPFRTGFARWRQVLCLLPLYVLYSIIWVVYSLLPPLLQLLFWLPFMVLMLAFGIYWQFLLSAAAAGEPDQPFSELYSRGGRAFCYGWWRMLVVFLILIGVSPGFRDSAYSAGSYVCFRRSSDRPADPDHHLDLRVHCRLRLYIHLYDGMQRPVFPRRTGDAVRPGRTARYRT